MHLTTFSKVANCPVEKFEKHREEMDQAEAQSRTVKEQLRHATKSFKSVGLPTPPKVDRQKVEKRYSEIKEDLARAKLEWREALARSKVHEAGKLVVVRTAELEVFVQQATTPKKTPTEHLEQFERQSRLKFEELAASLNFAVKSAKELGVDKSGESSVAVDKCQAKLDAYFGSKKEEARIQNQAAGKLADLLSEYAKWSQETLRELRNPNYTPQKGKDVDERMLAIVTKSEAKMREIQSLKVKTPQLEPVHHEIIVATKAYRNGVKASKRNSKRLLKLKRDSGLIADSESPFVKEPKFSQIMGDSPYRERISKGDFLWSEEEIQKLVEDNMIVETKGLSVSEFEILTKDLAIGIVQSHASRLPEINDALFELCNKLFEQAIFNNAASFELKLNGTANILNWAGLRLKMRHLLYKGQAIFPILERAMLWLDAAAQNPKANRAKIQERVQAIEAIRKRTKNLDDCTSLRMKEELKAQTLELTELQELAEKLLVALE